ncbi:MAG: ABC transporter ATP-binding protein, partial [Clostridia bacterium]
NGKEVKDYSKFERSQLIAYQTHDSFLFSDSIENNITFGEKCDIDKLLQIVSIDKDVKEMTDGVDTVVGNGGIRLSGGQKQRVALARALNYNKKLIVLDDPISAVDIDTEKAIVSNLRQNFKDSVIIFISHRLTSFESFDKVLFLDNEESLFGSHSEIMAQSQLYNSIFQMQRRNAND